MAKKLIKLYSENELQGEAIFSITANGDYVITAEDDKVAIKEVVVNTNIPNDTILTVQYVSGSFGNDGDTYLSLHQPSSADDYILSSASGETLDECDSVVCKGVDTVYVWGNRYAVGEYNYDNFVSLENSSYDQAVAINLSVEECIIYLEHYYYPGSGGGGGQPHAGGAGS